MNDSICTQPWCTFLLIAGFLIYGVLLGRFFDILYDTWSNWKCKRRDTPLKRKKNETRTRQ